MECRHAGDVEGTAAFVTDDFVMETPFKTFEGIESCKTGVFASPAPRQTIVVPTTAVEGKENVFYRQISVNLGLMTMSGHQVFTFEGDKLKRMALKSGTYAGHS